MGRSGGVVRFLRPRSFWLRLVVNVGATVLVLVGLAFDQPLLFSEALAVGILAAFVGTVVMEFG
jgi:hypothetical protein